MSLLNSIFPYRHNQQQVELLGIAHIKLTCQINDYGVFFIPAIDIAFSHQPHIYLCIFLCSRQFVWWIKDRGFNKLIISLEQVTYLDS